MYECNIHSLAPDRDIFYMDVNETKKGEFPDGRRIFIKIYHHFKISFARLS